MNREDSTPLQPWTDPELEARVVALVLGETSDFEREEIERHLAEQPELRLFKERIEEVHRLLGGREGAPEWKLSEERRAKVLAVAQSKSNSPWWAHPAFRIAAAVVVLGGLAWASWPQFASVGKPIFRDLDIAGSGSTKDSRGPWSDDLLAAAPPPPPASAPVPAPIQLAARARDLAKVDETRSLARKSQPALSQAGGEGSANGVAPGVDGFAMAAPAEPDPLESLARRGGAAGDLPEAARTAAARRQEVAAEADEASLHEKLGFSEPVGGGSADGVAPQVSAGRAFAFSPPPLPAPASPPVPVVADPFADLDRPSLAKKLKFETSTAAKYDGGTTLGSGDIELELAQRESDVDRKGFSKVGAGILTLRLPEESLAKAAETPAAVPESLTRTLAEARPQSPAPPADLETDAATEPFSTFSLHVSDVSFQLAQAALAKSEWPDRASVRIEEFVNAFDYGDPSPDAAEPVACRIEQAAHPFLQQRNLLRFGIRTASTGRGASSPLRLTLLLDRSGSMERPDRQETVQRALEQLAAQMRDGDELTVIAFARQPRLVVDRANRETAAQLPASLAAIPTEGGTNLEAALDLAAEKARATKTPGAQNRIVLLTDGAANLGDAHPDRLAARIHALRQEGIAFDAAGIGADGLNDRILEALTRKGDGRYYLLNGPQDADEGFARKLAGAFRPGAKDVKVQIQFNPDRVGRYRLLGFEEHRLEKEEFRDDTVDAAELASEEAGVAMYQAEIKPNGSGDVGFVSVRFLDVASGKRVERRWLIPFEAKPAAFDQAPPSLRLASLAAWTAAKLKDDPAAASTEWPVLNRMHAALPEDWKSAPRVRELGEMLHMAGASSPR